MYGLETIRRINEAAYQKAQRREQPAAVPFPTCPECKEVCYPGEMEQDGRCCECHKACRARQSFDPCI
jgi:acetyl-CoA carboxylase beta subunit